MEIGELIVKLLFDDSGFQAGAARGSSSFSRLGADFARIGQRINTTITASFAAAGAAITGFAAASAVVGAEFEKQIDIVGAISGATVGELGQLEARARELGATTEFTASQAAEGLRVLAQAGVPVQESLRLSGVALDLASANAVDLEQSTQALVAVTRAFASQNVSASQASDVLTRATQKSLLTFSDIQTALQFAGPAAAAFGISFEETAAILGRFRDVGLDASIVGTTFRQTLAQATQQTDKQAAALSKIGLTFDDIDPKANGFIGIIENLAGATAEADDLLAIFGTRAGPNLKLLVDAVNEGRVDIRALVAELEDAGGTTEKTADQIRDNTSTSFKLVISALQDVQIELSKAFTGPLQQAFEALAGQPGEKGGGFLGQVQEAISDVSAEIRDNVQVAVTTFRDVLERDGQAAAEGIAQAFVVAARALSAFASVVDQLAKAFGLVKTSIDELGLTPLIDDLIVVLGLAATAGSALTALAGPLLATGAGTTALTTAVGALGGPLGILAAAVTALTVGWIQYRVAVEEARLENQAMLDVNNSLARSTAQIADELAGGQEASDLVANSLQALADRESAAAAEGRELTGALKDEAKELRDLQDLADEKIDLKIRSGELIRVGGELRTVAAIVEDLDPEGFKALESQARLLRAQAKAINDELEDQTKNFEEQKKAAAAGAVPVFQEGTEAQTERLLEERRKFAEGLTEAAESIETQQAAATKRTLENAERAEKQATATAEREGKLRVAASKAEADARIKEANRAANEIRQALSRAQDVGAGLFLSEPEQVRRELDLQQQAIRASLDTFLANFSGTETERRQIIANAEAAILQERTNAQERLRVLAKNSLDEAEQAARDRASVVAGATADEIGEVEQIRREAQGRLRDVDEAAAAEREAVLAATEAKRLQLEQQFLNEGLSVASAAFNAEAAVAGERADRLAEIDSSLADDRTAINEDLSNDLDKVNQQIATDAEDTARAIAFEFAGSARTAAEAFNVLGTVKLLPGEEEDRLRAFFQTLRDQPGFLQRQFQELGQDVGGSLVSAFGANTLQAVSDFGKAITAAVNTAVDISKRLLDDLTGGFGLDITGTVDELIGIQQGAQESVQNAEQAVREAERAAAAGEASLQDVAAARTELREAEEEAATSGADLIRDAADQAINFVETLADNVGPVLEEFTAAIPRVIGAIAENLGSIIQQIVDALPGLITALGEAAVTLIGELPGIVSTLLAGLPDIITALLAQIPTIINALVAAIPPIIASLIGSLPSIFAAIIEGLPGIFASLLTIGPQIVTGLIAEIPNLILQLITSLPQLFNALITFFPQLVLDFVTTLATSIPTIIGDLVTSLVTEFPDMAKRAVKAFFQGIKDAFNNLVSIFGDIFRAAFNPLRKLFEKDEEKAEERRQRREERGGLFGGGGESAQGGIPFIARTARALVHPGEAILNAQQNRERLLGSRGSARNPAVPAGGANLAGPGPAAAPMELRIAIGDRDLDRFTVESDARGGRALTNKAARRKTGTKVGLRRRNK